MTEIELWQWLLGTVIGLAVGGAIAFGLGIVLGRWLNR